jgi:xylan 1,4-beta-xylosidase
MTRALVGKAAPYPDGHLVTRRRGLPAGSVIVHHHRVDATHSNIAAQWSGGEWPDDAGWGRLHASDHLDQLEPERTVAVGPDGALTLEFALPMPSVSLIEVRPVG